MLNETVETRDLSRPGRKAPYHPTYGELGWRILLAAITGVGTAAKPVVIDSFSAYAEAAPRPLNDTASREFSLREKINSIELTWTAGMSGQLYRHSKDGLTILTTLTGGTSAFSDLSAPDTSCYLIISEGQINSNLNCIIKSSRTGISPEISIKRILNTVTLGLTRHGNSDDSQLFILGTTQEIVPVPGALNEITVNTSNKVFCGVLIAAQSTSSVACAIDLLPASGLTPTPAALKTATAATTNTPSVSPIPSKTEIVTPTRTPETSIYTKIRTSFGVEFKASQEVSNAAMDKAVQNFIDLTTKEPESRNRMIANRFGGYRVFGRNQKLTDLPEFSHLKGVYYSPGILYDDFRGAANQGPDGVTAIGEDLLLDWPGLGIHEQAHPRLTYGFTVSQIQDWDSFFNSAKSQGLFPGKYAMNSKDEFWAESAASWRGYSQTAGFTPNDLNQIPGVYGFLRDRLGDPISTPQTDQVLTPRDPLKPAPVPGKDFL